MKGGRQSPPVCVKTLCEMAKILKLPARAVRIFLGVEKTQREIGTLDIATSSKTRPRRNFYSTARKEEIRIFLRVTTRLFILSKGLFIFRSLLRSLFGLLWRLRIDRVGRVRVADDRIFVLETVLPSRTRLRGGGSCRAEPSVRARNLVPGSCGAVVSFFAGRWSARHLPAIERRRARLWKRGGFAAEGSGWALLWHLGCS
jgi:hypothetical protein